MIEYLNLTQRNVKLYFSDKAMFFSSLISPIILLVLYTLFLGKVFKQTFTSTIPKGISISSELISSLVSGQILASLIAVTCVTVAFSTNLIMIKDKSSGVINDINSSPVLKSTLSLSYFSASFISTLIVGFMTLLLGLLYTYTQGWFYSSGDVANLIFDVVLLSLFGCSLSSIINFSLKTEGQATAVNVIMSSGYGFICGAYIPLSSLSSEMQRIFSFLPGTYGTALVKDHALSSPLNHFKSQGVSVEFIDELKKYLDINLTFFNSSVSQISMYVIMTVSIFLFILVFILQNKLKKHV